jgi:hypothetical protein
MENTPAQETKSTKGATDLKAYLVLQGQVMFDDKTTGVNLNLFKPENSFCKTPKKVLESPEKYPQLLAAIRLGHICTTDKAPTEFTQNRYKPSSTPFMDILNQGVQEFKVRIERIQSIELIGQLSTVESARKKQEGGPRPQYLNLLEQRKTDLIRALEKRNSGAYDDNQSALKPAVVAKQIIKAKELTKKPTRKK